MATLQRIRSVLTFQTSLLNSLASNLGCASRLPSSHAASHETQPQLHSLARTFHWNAALLASLQVKVPALGESITDGTISAVLKQAGDRVEEDEPIVQIETDKVTVDVRAPVAGTIEAILVKQDENVEVGHVIAAIAQGAASSTGASAPPTASAQQEEQPSASSTGTMNVPASTTLASETPPAPAAEHHGYQAQIAFPPRRAPDGGVLSMMPKEKAQEILQVLMRSMGTGGNSTSSAATTIGINSTAGSVAAAIRPRRSAPVELPHRRPMSDAEIDAIMLGGAF